MDQFVGTVQDPSCMKELSPGRFWWDLGKNNKNKVGAVTLANHYQSSESQLT
jgi:hypothetical protein